MRPIYETDSDREKELAIIKRFNKVYPDVRVEKQPTLSSFDYAIVNKKGKVKAWAEIKDRSYKWSMRDFCRKGGYMISKVKKWDIANEELKKGLPFMLLVNDRVKVLYSCIWSTYPLPDFPVALGGRMDRGDPLDVEDCVYIPCEEFTILEDKKQRKFSIIR